jgi:hypothetical protein
VRMKIGIPELVICSVAFGWEGKWRDCLMCTVIECVDR